MKTWYCASWLRPVLAVSLALAFFAPLPSLAGSEESARITKTTVEDDVLLVTVTVPEGLRKITLESRARLGSGNWQPRAVARIAGQATELVFRVPIAARPEFLRVRGDATEPLPAGFYEGRSTFEPEPGGTYFSYRWWALDAEGGPGGPPVAAPTTEVVESDIWKLSGDTLYYFNQYRGLQVINLTDIDNPVLEGALNLPAAGEEMYLLGESHALLLAGNSCYGSGSGPESSLLLVNVSAMPPRIVATVDLAGSIRESRLVGDVLYVAAQTYRQNGAAEWEWGTLVSSHNLADPERPVSREAIWFPGWQLTVNATPEYFFVATPAPESPERTRIHCLDITDAEGRFNVHATVTTRGTLSTGNDTDKFRISWHEGVLRVASEGARFDTTSTLLNWLETFRLPDPRAAGPESVVKLGERELGLGERLFATRFDGARAYLVTYRVIDPLWILDLSDPANPRLAGELHVPGWSTHIQPFGDLLLAMGIDDTDGRRTAVSLFDVADPAHPTLAKRVSLGEGYSWSEANQTDKAFTVLPDDGLILVPYYGNGTEGYASRVQLIDLDLVQKTLQLRGEILHPFGARRATVHQDRVISISGLELLCADISDRDHPAVTAELPLAWSVDRVLLYADWLIQISQGGAWNGGAAIRVTSQSDPTHVVATLAMTASWPILGADVREETLWIMQGLADGVLPGPEDPTPEPVNNLQLTGLDLRQIGQGQLPVQGRLEAEVKPLGWGGQYRFLWPGERTLVLAGGSGWYPYGWPGLLDGPAIGWRYPSWYGGDPGESRFIAINLDDPAQPTLRSDLDLAEIRADALSFTRAHLVGDLIYLSHGRIVPAKPIEIVNPDTGQLERRDPPEWFQVVQHLLDVIDYADPDDPTVREPIDLPGRLEAVDRDGALLYTIGTHWTPNPEWAYDYQEWLDVSSYDGVEARVAASLQLTSAWWHPVLVHRGSVFLGQTQDAADGGNNLEIWQLDEDQLFHRVGRLELPGSLGSLLTVDDLLIGQGGDRIAVFDAQDPPATKLLVIDRPDGCLWVDPAHAVGSRTGGLWFPVGFNGVWHLPLP